MNGYAGPQRSHDSRPSPGWRSRLVTLLVALGMVVALSALDYVSGSEVSFSIFYLAPVAFATWFAGRAEGLAVAVFSAATWGIVDVAAGATYASPVIPAWNATVRLGFFAIVTLLLATLQRSHRAEREMARSDPLTGIANGRVFYERLESEIARSARTGRPFAVAYLDLDHFKWVNDHLGHAGGDDLLGRLAGGVRDSLRAVDTVARLGGDEFGILLPETGEATAEGVLSRMRLHVCEVVRGIDGLPEGVGATIGCVVFGSTPADTDVVVGQADALMYEGKHAGRGRILMRVWPDGPIRVLAAGCEEGQR